MSPESLSWPHLHSLASWARRPSPTGPAGKAATCPPSRWLLGAQGVRRCGRGHWGFLLNAAGPRGTRAFSGGWALEPRSGHRGTWPGWRAHGESLGARPPWAWLASPEGQAAGAWGLALGFKAAVAPVGSLGAARGEVGSTGLAWPPSGLVPTPDEGGDRGTPTTPASASLGVSAGVVWRGAGHLLAVWLCQARCRLQPPRPLPTREPWTVREL